MIVGKKGFAPIGACKIIIIIILIDLRFHRERMLMGGKWHLEYSLSKLDAILFLLWVNSLIKNISLL